jgi:hypothetical protein
VNQSNPISGFPATCWYAFSWVLLLLTNCQDLLPPQGMAFFCKKKTAGFKRGEKIFF